MNTHNASARFQRGGLIAWGIMTLLAIGTAFYAVSPYVTLNPAVSRIPLNPIVPLHFLILTLHAGAGGIALIIGPLQFLQRFRERYPKVHRLFGRIYIICILISCVMAMYSAIISVDGFVAQVGFIVLAGIWFYSIVQAYIAIRRGQVLLHRIWMIRNYALTTAAIVLRIFVGVGIGYLAFTHNLHGSKVTSTPIYICSAWISWIIPLIVVEWFINQRLLHSIVVKQDRKAMQGM